jgi:glycine cleavage system regulatory protein
MCFKNIVKQLQQQVIDCNPCYRCIVKINVRFIDKHGVINQIVPFFTGRNVSVIFHEKKTML